MITTLAVSFTTLIAVVIIGLIGFLIDKAADQRDKQ